MIFLILLILIIIFLIIFALIRLEQHISDIIYRRKILLSLRIGDKLYKCNFIKNDDEYLIDRNSIIEETITDIHYNSIFNHFKNIYTLHTNNAIYKQNDILQFKNESLWRKSDIDFFIVELNNEKTLSDIMLDDKHLIIKGLKMLKQQSIKYNMLNITDRVTTLIDKIE